MASPSYPCRVCGKGFKSQNAVNGHMRSHKGKKLASPAFPLPITSLEPVSSAARRLEVDLRCRIINMDLNEPPTEKDDNNDDKNASAGTKIQENDSAWARGSEIDVDNALDVSHVTPPKKQFDLNELPLNEDDENDDNAAASMGL